MKTQLVNDIAEALTSYGYTVYLSKDKQHGFYTDGKRVVSFGGCWNYSVDFSGNYAQSQQSGTGWQIAKEQGVPTKEQADRWINENAPRWTQNYNPVYTTPEQHLKTYGSSSGYALFTPIAAEVQS